MADKQVGTVYLVGAGPGDPGLLTCRAGELLARAQCVVYDALVSPAILALIPRDARKIPVGKRAGAHSHTQEQIHDILARQALAGQEVVRLKGGDPFVFGRGGEEGLYLTGRGIPVQVVPGVSSALAVPACCGIPVTHRGLSASVHIITARGASSGPEDLPYEHYARLGGTLVFLMGLRAVPELCRGLMDAGMDPATPAALLWQGTTACQGSILCDLRTAPEQTAQARSPAIFLVGQAGILAKELAFRERLPLFGLRIINTQLRPQDMSPMLRELGAEVLDISAISTRETGLPLPEGFFHWVVFTSPEGVRQCMAALRRQKRDIRSLAGAKLAALGPCTAQALEALGLIPDFLPTRYDGATLGQELGALLESGQRVLVPRSRLGSPALIQALSRRGAQVVDVPLYDTVSGVSTLPEHSLEGDCPILALFGSPSGVRSFQAACTPEELEKVTALCLGPVTGEAARVLGFRTLVADAPGAQGVADRAMAFFTDWKQRRGTGD